MKLFSVLALSFVILCALASADDAQLMRMFQQTFGPPCPNGWTRFKSYCYLVSSSIKTWHQAYTYCRALRGELVKINNAEENEFVLNMVNQRAPSLKQVWIGLKWDSRVNRFLWYDHSVPVYTNWAPHEPNGKAREPCGHMWTGHTGHVVRASGYWNDLTCGVVPHLPCGLVCKKLP